MLEVIDSPATRFAQETERRRLARELHDGVVQSLTALVADLEYFRTRHLATSFNNGKTSQEVESKLETWQELARESLTSMRQTLGELRTQTNVEVDLETCIQSLLHELRSVGYTVTYECTDWPANLSFEYTSNLYSIIREALVNIRKHAQASHILLFLFRYENKLHVSIGDNGIGISKDMKKRLTLSSQHNGFQQGLIGLRERTQLLGGRLSIESEPSKGTRVDVDVPLP